jgi:hypothetical protein
MHHVPYFLLIFVTFFMLFIFLYVYGFHLISPFIIYPPVLVIDSRRLIIMNYDSLSFKVYQVYTAVAVCYTAPTLFRVKNSRNMRHKNS